MGKCPSAFLFSLIRQKGERQPMEEQKKELTKAEIIKRHNLKPFKPLAEQTEEEREYFHNIRSQGGKARQEQIAKRKSMQEATQELLYKVLNRDQAQNILGNDSQLIDDKDLNVMNVMICRMLQEVVANGNTRAFEAIRDTGGFAPKKEVELQADIITDADKSLIENLNQRLSG